MNTKDIQLTFDNNRHCLYCEKPIADQEHAAREFCKKFYDDLGKVHDCKTAYHRTNDKPEREIHSNIIRDHKFFAKQITEMIIKKGYEVTTDDLNAYDIVLSDSIRLEIKKDGTAISHFLQYMITSNPITNKHKIIKHE